MRTPCWLIFVPSKPRLGWVLIFALLLAVSASAEVTFLVIGDPQAAFRCADAGVNAWGQYKDLSRAECIAFQMGSLHSVLQFAEDIDVDFVAITGDHVDRMSETDAREAMRDELADHPDLTIYSVMGNHDIGTSSCAHWSKYLLNALNDVSVTRRPIWETWEVDGHYFMGLSTELWSWDLRACLHLAETYPTPSCIDIGRNKGAACSSGGASDNYGISTCDPGAEVCSDPEGYAKDQMRALGNLVATVAADNDAKSFALVSHILGWTAEDAQGVSQDNSWTRVHNARQCDDGDLSEPYDLCDEVGSGAFNCEAIEAANPGPCDDPVAVGGYDWRNQVEAALAGLPDGMMSYWFSGHIHRNLSPAEAAGQSGTTTDDGVEYEFYTTLGTGAPSYRQGYDEGGSALNHLSARLVSIDDDGDISQRLVPASGQTAPRESRESIHDRVAFPSCSGPQRLMTVQ